MSLFPSGIVNYQLPNAIIAQTYDRTGQMPYQYNITQVGDNGQLNYETQRLQNIARANLNKEIKSIPQVPSQYTYTTNLDKLSDFMKIRLYSPSTNYDRVPPPGLLGATISAVTGVVQWIKSAPLFGDFIIPKTLQDQVDKTEAAAKGGNPTNTSNDPWVKYLESNDENYLRSNFYQYKNPKSPQQNQEDIISKDNYAYTEIILPMPVEQIIDSHSHEVNTVPLNPTFVLMSILGDVWDKYVGSKMFKDDKGNRIYPSSSSNLVQYLLNAGSDVTKTTFNPNAEALYQSPVPRQFQFTINFVPTNKMEADMFITMCDMLKEHSYPISHMADTLYQFPGTCDFEFWINNKKGINLPYNMKPCLLTQVMVSYLNGTGTYTHYWDGNPTSIVLTLTFLEVEMLSRIDFLPAEDAYKLMSSQQKELEAAKQKADKEASEAAAAQEKRNEEMRRRNGLNKDGTPDMRDPRNRVF